MAGISEWGRYESALYVGLRDGSVDRTAAFDLACLILEYYPFHETATELAEASLADGDEPRLTEARLAEAARNLLAILEFEPGFDLEPELLATLERAMEVVNADIRATRLPGTVRLEFPRWDWSPDNAFVVTWTGDFGTTSGIFPGEARDPVGALVAVAEHAQDALMETLSAAWPLCPVHRLGLHARARDGAAVWWCHVGGHVAAPIGQLPIGRLPSR